MTARCHRVANSTMLMRFRICAASLFCWRDILSLFIFVQTPGVYVSPGRGQQTNNGNATPSDGHWQMEGGCVLCMYCWVDGWMMGEKRNSLDGKMLPQQVSWEHFVSPPCCAESPQNLPVLMVTQFFLHKKIYIYRNNFWSFVQIDCFNTESKSVAVVKIKALRFLWAKLNKKAQLEHQRVRFLLCLSVLIIRNSLY